MSDHVAARRIALLKQAVRGAIGRRACAPRVDDFDRAIAKAIAPRTVPVDLLPRPVFE